MISLKLSGTLTFTVIIKIVGLQKRVLRSKNFKLSIIVPLVLSSQRNDEKNCKIKQGYFVEE